jgi:hypothetical protein
LKIHLLSIIEVSGFEVLAIFNCESFLIFYESIYLIPFLHSSVYDSLFRICYVDIMMHEAYPSYSLLPIA